MAKRCGIIQSNYIPWKGYFDIIAAVDEFVILDIVQYTRQDWRNRNVIARPGGYRWLTIPVSCPNRMNTPINTVRVADGRWAARHAQILRDNYKNAACFDHASEALAPLFAEAGALGLLSDINETLIRRICGLLGIRTPIRRAEEFGPFPTDRNDRLIHICKAVSADRYLSGPAARSYIDIDRFNAAGVAVEFVDYDGYPAYPQLGGKFNHHVSIVDLIFNTGEGAPRFMKHVGRDRG